MNARASLFKLPIRWSSARRLGLLVLMMLLGRAASALVITNVSVVNVTPSSFSIVWAASPGVTPSISLFADAGGVTNLAGQLELEFYPLNTGAPTLTNAYDRRVDQALLRQKTISQGLVYVRVSQCAPQTAYYYQLEITDTNGQQVFWPASGPLPAVTTALENDFVVQSRQLLVNLPGFDPSGSIVILSNSNTPSLLAAVAGDGAPSNQVYFSTSDLLDAAGGANYLPLGNQQFIATVLGTSSNSIAQSYTLNFTADFLVGAANQFSFGNYALLDLGSAVLRAGDAVSIPVGLYASGITNLSFVLNLPTNRFSSLTVQALSGQIGSATFQPIGPNSFRASFAAVAGQTLQGNQTIAQFNFTTVTGQVSAFVPLVPQSLQAFNADGSSVANFAVQGGQLTIVGAQPLLQAMLAPDLSRSLALYGIPGATYQIQYKTNLAGAGGWNNLVLLPLTNLVESVPITNRSLSIAFYRAYQVVSGPPVLEAEGGNVLLLFGTPGLAYEVDYATSLGFPVSWRFLQRIPMVNSFQQFPGLNAGPNVFYRARVLNADPPVLDARLNGLGRSLVLYGLPNTNYTLQYSTNLSPTVTWYPQLSYTLTNSFQFVTNLPATNRVIFYRIRKP